MADVYELEAMDGVRMTWNIWPNSKTEAAKCQIPFAAFYTPTREIQNMMVCPYEPVRCKTCMGVLNPYARVDFIAKMWVCPLCMSRNQFPTHYAAISEQNLPGELFPQYCTIEYQIPRQMVACPPAYFFVVDTCMMEDEVIAARSAVQQALQLLPEDCLIGLVTFGQHVQVHELGASDLPRSFVIQGRKAYTTAQIRDHLGVSPRRGSAGVAGAVVGGPGPVAAPVADGATPGGGVAGQPGKFLAPLGECEYAVNTILDNLGPDPWPSVAEHRLLRCAGSALQVASAILSGSVPPGGGECRIMLLIGGPITVGAGAIVGTPLEEPIRSHKDLKAGGKKSAYFKGACDFYESLSEEMASSGQCLDVFICALDQIGLLEMKPCAEKTGGVIVQSDTFSSPMFRETFKRVFASRAGVQDDGDAPPVAFANSVHLEVLGSRDIKVMGLLGPGSKAQRKGAQGLPPSDKPVGIGGTNAWRLACATPTTTPCIFFEITGQYKNKDEMVAAANANQQFFLQFQTMYLLPSGEARLRISTITRKWTDGSNVGELIGGFDQEAAAVAMARLMSWRMETEEDFDASRFLDRTLIALCQRLGDYRKDDPASFNLAPQLSLYPQFMFNLRRSQFVQVFGNSPDETAFARIMLGRESVGDAIVMMQPSLVAYSFSGAPQAVLLDVASIAPERILLLDAYFTVVIFHGTTIAQWRKANYQADPQHASFAQLLEAPRIDARAIIRARFPSPRLVDCDQNGSQSRFLLAKLNPSATYSNIAGATGEVIMTDDVSLQVFMEHLKKLAVQSA